MVGVRIFWVGWGLMQHHDWESGGWLLLLWLGVWGTGKEMLPGEWEVEELLHVVV